MPGRFRLFSPGLTCVRIYIVDLPYLFSLLTTSYILASLKPGIIISCPKEKNTLVF